MAKRAYGVATVTPTAVADTTNFTDSGYIGIVQGGSSTHRVAILEVYAGGLAAAASVAQMLVARDSTVGVTISGGTDAALDPATAALAAPALVGCICTTKPQRSSTLHLLTLAFNAFGGLVRWVAAQGEELLISGNTASLGEISVSFGAASGTGAVGGHIIYEPL